MDRLRAKSGIPFYRLISGPLDATALEPKCTSVVSKHLDMLRSSIEHILTPVISEIIAISHRNRKIQLFGGRPTNLELSYQPYRLDMRVRQKCSTIDAQWLIWNTAPHAQSFWARYHPQVPCWRPRQGLQQLRCEMPPLFTTDVSPKRRNLRTNTDVSQI